MAKWIFLSILSCVVAAPCCREGDIIQDQLGSRSRYICKECSWYKYRCISASRYDTENTFQKKINCSEGMLFFVEDNPDTYYQCNDGELVLKMCPKGQEINRETKTCSPMLLKLKRSSLETESYGVDASVGMMCDEGSAYMDVSSSSSYYKCTNRRLVPQKCYDGTVFDSRKRRCVSQDADSFISNKGQCNHGETRRKEGSCKQYYECKDGTEVISRCMDCQNYDEKQKRCRYVFDSPCDSQFPEPPTTSASDLTTGHGVWTSDPTPSESEVTEVTDTSTGTGSEVTKASTGAGSEVTEVTETSTEARYEVTTAPNATAPPTPPEPESSALPFGDCRHRRALPDCKYYLECHEGELVTRRCGWLQYFDSVTSTCSFMGYKCYGTEKK